MCIQKLAGEPELFPSINKGLTLTSSTKTNKASLVGSRCNRDSKHLGPAPAVSRKVGLAMPRSEQHKGCHTPRGRTCHRPGMAWMRQHAHQSQNIACHFGSDTHTAAHPQEESSPSKLPARIATGKWHFSKDDIHSSSFRETKWPALTGQWCTTLCVCPSRKGQSVSKRNLSEISVFGLHMTTLCFPVSPQPPDNG